ncbi:MAG: cell division protein ZapE [Betaproteobacteria bacterium]|nr:cell division protein ZapE [Betaproteobacteria bacterium]
MGQPAQANDPQSFADHAQQAARSHGFSLDSAQLRVLGHFQRLHDELTESEQAGNSLLRVFLRQRPVRGLYLRGGVGRGKSFLMDAFFDSVPIERKSRVHFHRFMQDIHHRLRDLQGEENPLLHIARDISQQLRLLCLDEFHVTDIGDAMLMRNLLQGLFDQGLVLVTTSNQKPDDLYRNGLQRAQFLPAIDLIKEHLETLHVDGGVDYRLRVLEKGGVFHFPADARAAMAMANTFEAIAGGPGERDVELEIEGRAIRALRTGPGVAWFRFGELCSGPRGQADYIELARRYHTVLISEVRRLGPGEADRRRRFTWLIDEFYDRRVKLILSAEVHLTELLQVAASEVEAERATSRLVEMQTRQYLSEAHLA